MSLLVGLPAVLVRSVTGVADLSAALLVLPGRLIGLVSGVEQTLATAHAALASAQALLDRVDGITDTADETVRAAHRTTTAAAVHPTRLITSGPFRVVRNPTYTSLLGCSLSIGVLGPTMLAASGVVICLAALQVQTRLVEEPHLRRVHRQVYQRYAAHVGRFLPGVGRLRDLSQPT
jgi:protein-S-isoprenylcysteine O-methyltransferase Ste14